MISAYDIILYGMRNVTVRDSQTGSAKVANELLNAGVERGKVINNLSKISGAVASVVSTAREKIITIGGVTIKISKG